MRESELTQPLVHVRHLSLIYRRRTRKSLVKADIASRIAQVHPAGRGHVSDTLPPRVGGQRRRVPAERLRDGSVVEFDFGRTASGTDIGANYVVGKRLRRHLALPPRTGNNSFSLPLQLVFECPGLDELQDMIDT
jgi:hypothetical protein